MIVKRTVDFYINLTVSAINLTKREIIDILVIVQLAILTVRFPNVQSLSKIWIFSDRVELVWYWISSKIKKVDGISMRLKKEKRNNIFRKVTVVSNNCGILYFFL